MTFREEWTKESIKEAFEKFVAVEGRLPTAPEIDKSDYLPSARQIQRKYGGLRVLRAELGYDVVDFGSGASRSSLATSNNVRSMEAERSLEKEFIALFGELFVHTEKLYGKGRNRVDFLVYTKSGNFGVDVFTTETQRDMQKNVNIKVDKYADFPLDIPLYFAVASLTLTDDDVHKACMNMSKLTKLPNLEVVTISELVSKVRDFTPLDPPVGFVSAVHG
jgi:hypothetical protein